MKEGTVFSISINPKRGELKNEVPEANFRWGWGISGDGHAGDWDRQVTCLDLASVKRMNSLHGLDAGPGDFAENILIEGMDLSSLEVGDKLLLGDTVKLEIAQIGKEDHPSVVTERFGVSLLPDEGLFCRILEDGVVKKGDRVRLG